MKRIIQIFFSLFTITVCYGQVGINTENPLGIFHIDAMKNTSGTTNISDDVLIDNAGNMGIGTTLPSNKLTINTTGANTGLHLPNGAGSGRVLTSDINGNAVWISGANQYQTGVYGGADEQIAVNGVIFPNMTKINTLSNVLVDKAKEIYGNTYGWDNAKQQYVAPVNGVYRIAFQVYFQTRGNIGENFRAYLHRNGTQFLTPGIVSVTDAGLDIAAYVMGIATLNKGDVIDLRIGSMPYGRSAYWSGIGHTFLLIESL